jgi:hypothetical protein
MLDVIVILLNNFYAFYSGYSNSRLGNQYILGSILTASAINCFIKNPSPLTLALAMKLGIALLFVPFVTCSAVLEHYEKSFKQRIMASTILTAIDS